MTTTIQEIEANIETQKVLIELGKCLQRLEANRDFQKIIEIGYLKDEAVRLVHLKALPMYRGTTEQADIIKRIDAIGVLKTYLSDIKFNHDQAIKEIEMASSAIEELIEEGNV